MPIESNKTTGNLRRYDKPPCSRYNKAGYNCHTHRHLLLTLILTLYSKVAKFRLAKHKASINAITICLKIHPYEETYPSNVDFLISPEMARTIISETKVLLFFDICKFICFFLYFSEKSGYRDSDSAEVMSAEVKSAEVQTKERKGRAIILP